MQLYQEKKLWHRWFAGEVLSDINEKNCIHKIYLQENTGDGVFLAQLQTCGVTIFQSGIYHEYFSMNIVKFHRTSIFQNNDEQLLLISCEVFDVSPALSVINQFNHSMEI